MEAHAIFGPPGTGKTTELIREAAQLAERHREVLYLSYTRAAAQEAASRLPEALRQRITPSTIHAYAFSQLRLVPAQVVDAKKLISFGKITGIPFKGSEPDSVEMQEGDEYVSVLSYARNKLITANVAYDKFGCPGTRARFEAFVKSYHEWKNTFGYVDFDDMIAQIVCDDRLDIRQPAAVCLDEAQDLSGSQWEAFTRITRSSRDVVIAGDDDQAIYEWNGADPHGMDRFIEGVCGGARVLKQSYRVPREPKSVAINIISPVRRRVKKEWNARPEDGVLENWGDMTDCLSHLDAIAPDGAMVLVRDRFRLEELKREFNRMMVPYDARGTWSPWTSAMAKNYQEGRIKIWDIPPAWQSFYKMADLDQPIKFVLSTIHQAKGREADTVIVDLSLPARVLESLTRDPDPERRVMYVALTRARTKLILCAENPLI